MPVERQYHSTFVQKIELSSNALRGAVMAVAPHSADHPHISKEVPEALDEIDDLSGAVAE
jgi:hypothetical protein